jgi:transposase-like protein
MFGNLLGFPGLDLGIVDDEPSLSAPGAWVCLEPMLDFFNREMGDCSRHSCHIVPPSRWKFSPPLFYHGMRIGMRRTTDSWRVDETYVKAKGEWMYLSRAVDSQGNTLEFLLSATRDAQAAKRFFAKALHASHTVTPRVITVDKNAASPKALKEMKAAGDLAASCELQQSKYLNNLVEQDHRFIKWLVKPGMGFFSFETAWNTLQGYERMNMLRKGQMHGVEKGNITGQISFIASLFGLVA